MPPGKSRWWNPFVWAHQHGRLVLCLFALPLIGFLVYSLSLFNIGGVSSSVEQVYFRFVTHTARKTLSSQIRLVYMDQVHNQHLLDANKGLKHSANNDDVERQRWRSLDAKLIAKLVNAGAAVVAFDFRFPGVSPAAKGANQQFLEAIRDAASDGRTRIVIGRVPGEAPDNGLSQVSSLEYGNVWIGGGVIDAKDDLIVSRVALAISDGHSAHGMSVELPERPMPMPLLLFLNAEWPESSFISYGLDAGGRDVTISKNGRPIRHIHTETGLCSAHDHNCKVPKNFEWQRMALLPLVMPTIDSPMDVPYEDVLAASSLPNYQKKIVIVGARIPKEKVSVPGSETGAQIYGYQVHAAILSDLLEDTYPRYPSGFSQLLIFFFIAGMAVLARRWLPVKDIKINTIVFGERQVPSGLLILVGIYGIAGVVVYSVKYLVLNVAYDLPFLVLAYFTYGRKSPGSTEPAK